MDTTATKSRLRGIEARLGALEGFREQLLASTAPNVTRGAPANPVVVADAPVKAGSARHSIPAGAFDIDSFCAAHNISRSKLYQLWTDGTGPDWMQVGARRLISCEAAARWRRQREEAARSAAKTA
jgi:hypothetical protein